jgi:hypothetical protein
MLGKIRASFLEIFSVKSPEKRHHKDTIHFYGEDNLYPYSISNVIDNSPTGKRCSNFMFKTLLGGGLEVDYPINDNLMLSDIVEQIFKSISKNYGSYLWVGYGINQNGGFEINNLKVLPYTDGRIRKSDHEGNDGRIYFKKWNETEKFNSKITDKWFYPYNNNQNVIRKQIENDFGKPINETNFKNALKNYRGQVYHINLTPDNVYSLPIWDSVFNEMDSESRIVNYTNIQVRRGFLGKIVVQTNNLNPEIEIKIKKDISKFLGSENSDSVWFLPVEGFEDLENSLRVLQLKPQYDDKLFKETDIRIKSNILGAFNNIPEDLLFKSASLFSKSAELYQQLKNFAWEQNDYERNYVEVVMKQLGYEIKLIQK